MKAGILKRRICKSVKVSNNIIVKPGSLYFDPNVATVRDVILKIWKPFCKIAPMDVE